ncbi:hypothetical protein [Aquimarina aquimarini]|uniref:hypothetical protein n=1 Tax=Aquimarina aquimarini TaxID=1191734 RepID=UPI000D55F62E|nr:hypothetical protein [Aquimarina aquimarini]
MKTRLLYIVIFGITFGVKAQSQITELANGNVGIGTINPETKLHLGGLGAANGIQFENKFKIRTSGDNNNHFVLEHQAPDGNLFIRSKKDSIYSGDIILNDLGGKIGIGTRTPSNGLVHIYRKATTGGFPSVTPANAGLRIQDNGSSLYLDGNTMYSNGNMILGTIANKSFSIGTNNVERFKITNAGNVGIGTRSPSNGLVHIYRNATTGGFPSVTPANAGLRIQDNESSLYLDGNTMYSNGNMILGTIANKSFSIGTNNVERFRITNTGDVGIGVVNTKGFKLGVKGRIAAEEVKVALHAQWADFVFDKEYVLPTLQEVETHIKEKGHLKDIPSAEEVKKDGFFLGQMDARLLQKIEELTLYTIQQDKKLKSQDSKIEKLEKKNEELSLLNKKFIELQSRLEKIESEK